MRISRLGRLALVTGVAFVATFSAATPAMAEEIEPPKEPNATLIEAHGNKKASDLTNKCAEIKEYEIYDAKYDYWIVEAPARIGKIQIDFKVPGEEEPLEVLFWDENLYPGGELPAEPQEGRDAAPSLKAQEAPGEDEEEDIPGLDAFPLNDDGTRLLVQTPAGWTLIKSQAWILHDQDGNVTYKIGGTCPAAPPSGGGGGLPVTGMNVTIMVVAGLVLLAAGGALFMVRRRRAVQFTV